MCEREREKERERESVCVLVRVCVCERYQGRERERTTITAGRPAAERSEKNLKYFNDLKHAIFLPRVASAGMTACFHT